MVMLMYVLDVDYNAKTDTRRLKSSSIMLYGTADCFPVVPVVSLPSFRHPNSSCETCANRNAKLFGAILCEYQVVMWFRTQGPVRNLVIHTN